MGAVVELRDSRAAAYFKVSLEEPAVPGRRDSLKNNGVLSFDGKVTGDHLLPPPYLRLRLPGTYRSVDVLTQKR